MEYKDKEEAQKWLKKAHKDILTAKVNLDNNEYEAAAFYSHQGAEKALKALHILKFRRLWKIHDLEQLAIKVGAGDGIVKLCGTLNPHYIATRYPTDIVYRKENAEDAIENCRMVIEWVKGQTSRA